MLDGVNEEDDEYRFVSKSTRLVSVRNINLLRFLISQVDVVFFGNRYIAFLSHAGRIMHVFVALSGCVQPGVFYTHRPVVYSSTKTRFTEVLRPCE